MVIRGVTGFTPGPTDIVPSVSLAQILGPLANNGGPTQTHALVVGSPAIDAGNPNGCLDNAGMLLPTDQRGFARHVDANNDGTVRCDIRAYLVPSWATRLSCFSSISIFWIGGSTRTQKTR